LFGQHKPYVTLENPDEREFAEQDPLRFLQRFPHGAILDEVQRCPALLSWLQGLVDQRGGCRVMGWGGVGERGSAYNSALTNSGARSAPLGQMRVSSSRSTQTRAK
jgi:hypothetical protein